MSVSRSFAQKLAAQIGADPDRVYSILNSWEPWENANADFNPLATTQHASGSRPLGGNPGQNGGNPVQEYPDEDTGVAATAQTLMNGHYPDVVKWMQTGELNASAVASQIRTWGTTGFAREVEAGKVSGDYTPDATPPPVSLDSAIDSLRPGGRPSIADIRNPGSNPASLRDGVLGAYYDAKDALSTYTQGHGLILKNGVWGSERVKTERDLDPNSATNDPLPSGATIFTADPEANRLATSLGSLTSLSDELDKRIAAKFYGEGSQAAEQYISSMDLDQFDRQRQKNQWDDFVNRASDVQSLFDKALAYNSNAQDQNAQNVDQMHQGNAPWGSFGWERGFTAAQMPFGQQAMQLQQQQGFAQPGQGGLAALMPTTRADLMPQFGIPQDTVLPHFAGGTGGLAGVMGGAPPSPRWLPPLPTDVHKAAVASGIIGVPLGLWAMGRGQ